MLKIFTCECHGAEPLVRQLLQRMGVANWMDYPIHKGKNHCLDVLSCLPKQLHSLLAFRALQDYLPNASSFSIVVGYDEESFYWSDISDNAPVEVIQAEAIVKRFV